MACIMEHAAGGDGDLSEKVEHFTRSIKIRLGIRFISWAITMQLVFFGFFLFSGKLMELVGF